MDENEEFDELPPIEVDCWSPKTSNSLDSESFVMPAADELASQRERELLCEQELRALSASHVARCDSNSSMGSEGEAALAAAVQAMSVLAAPAPPAPPAPGADALSARAVLGALLPHLPPSAFLNKYLHAADYLDDATLAALTDDMVSHVCALVACDRNVWTESEAVALSAWLCAVSVGGVGCAGGGAGARRAARALRLLLAERVAPPHEAALCCALAHAPAAALLPLADALGGTAAAPDSLAARLASDLCDAALAHYLQVQKEAVSWSSCQEVAELVAARCGALQPDARYAVLQLVGRRLAAARAEHHEPVRLLRELERAPAHPHAHAPTPRYHTEHLKVSVGVSKLQSLFGRLQNNGHDQEILKAVDREE